MLGYWNDPEKTAQAIDPAGWIHTGDLAKMDEDGHCNVVGRIKDMVIRAGENIYRREIEEFLFRHPGIEAVQVIGVPDVFYGEELCAWIKLKAGVCATAEEIQVFCNGQIALQDSPLHPIRGRFPHDGDRKGSEIHHARRDDQAIGPCRTDNGMTKTKMCSKPCMGQARRQR
jgi:acyl-CoA synthetase (AMP-forming)/AMP-acid ligase II